MLLLSQTLPIIVTTVSLTPILSQTHSLSTSHSVSLFFTWALPQALFDILTYLTAVLIPSGQLLVVVVVVVVVWRIKASMFVNGRMECSFNVC